jgi:uncharacterized tellurite resistance protein B-like protein
MSISRPEPLTFTHSLSYVYLYMAYYGDDDGVTSAELLKITRKITEWNEQFTWTTAGARSMSEDEVNETIDYFNELDDEEAEEELFVHLVILREVLALENRRAFVDDLIRIARSDGHVSDAEEEFINLVAEAMEV